MPTAILVPPMSTAPINGFSYSSRLCSRLLPLEDFTLISSYVDLEGGAGNLQWHFALQRDSGDGMQRARRQDGHALCFRTVIGHDDVPASSTAQCADLYRRLVAAEERL